MSKSRGYRAQRTSARPLTETEITLIGGGLNPQPLPPRWTTSILVLQASLLRAF